MIATEKGHRKDIIFLGSLPVPEEEAVELVKAAIFSSLIICADYKAEIEATIEFVDKSLKDHGVSYYPKGGDRRK